MNTLPFWARHYVRLVMVCGAAVSIFAIFRYRVPDLWHMLLITILACQMATVKIRLRLGEELCSVSLSFPFIWATLLSFGLREGIIVAVFCALSQCLFNRQDPFSLHRTLFSVAALVLSISASGAAYIFCQGVLPMRITYIVPTALLVSLSMYWWVNTGLVSGAVSLSAGKPFWPVWMTNMKCSALSFSLGGLLALVLVYFFQAVGIGIFVLLCPLFYLTHYVSKLTFVRLKRLKT